MPTKTKNKPLEPNAEQTIHDISSFVDASEGPTSDHFFSPSPTVKTREITITDGLKNLQSSEQRQVLDAVTQIQRCGLQDVLSFPQLVACGDQSSGKSSMLEALTGVPFPRSDNLCTRYATEINLRRGNVDALTIQVTPDDKRPSDEQLHIKSFKETITNFDDLPRVMKMATKVMGIDEDLASATTPRAFARDILNITIEGPACPQLTLVDIPGLIATNTRGITKEDVDIVTAITDSYIENPRTICLAVISATNDYANQKILTKVRNVDPDGKRTLGIITKPDGLAANSGAEKAYIELAKNTDVVFELGWHVLKNRKFEESHYSLLERNAAEDTFVRRSNFKVLPREHLGIDELRKHLSLLLFEHVKKELPKLRKDLESNLQDSRMQMSHLGFGRATPEECKEYLFKISQDYWSTCKDAVNGHYEDGYFLQEIDSEFNVASASTIRRTRAVVQLLNVHFAQAMEINGHKYSIDTSNKRVKSEPMSGEVPDSKIRLGIPNFNEIEPILMGREAALAWVRDVIVRNRGKELIGNFNPLLIGELLREQSIKWRDMATDHIERVHDIEQGLEQRKQNALKKLGKIMSEVQSHPINYNHYYTDTIAKNRQERMKTEIAKCIKGAAKPNEDDLNQVPQVNVEEAVVLISEAHEANMESFSYSEALDRLLEIYKVSFKVFVANVTTQVIERHVVKGLETIFCPIVISAMSTEDVEAIASEPLATRHKREFLKDRIEKLQNGQKIFKKIMGGSLK